MKILHITNAYPYEDYESFGIFIKEQILSLERIKVQNEVIFVNAHKFGPKEYFLKRKRLREKIASFRPDIIHCHHEFSLLVLPVKLNIPVVLSLLGDISKRSKGNRLLFSLLKFRAKRIIQKNNSLVKPPFQYLPNGVDLSFFYPMEKIQAKNKLKLDIDKKYILFVTASKNNPIKRYDKFKSVLLNLNKKDNYFPLILSGVKRELVPYYYNAAEILLLTSDHEGSPNAVKEAMACNLPVVSTDVGNIAETFGKSKGNFLSRTGSIEDLTKFCLEALELERSDGRKRIIDINMDMDSIARKLQEIYKELLL